MAGEKILKSKSPQDQSMILAARVSMQKVWDHCQPHEQEVRAHCQGFNCHDYLTGGIKYVEMNFGDEVARELRYLCSGLKDQIDGFERVAMKRILRLLAHNEPVSEDIENELRSYFDENPFLPKYHGTS
ncbi:hypothetical protein IE53DRAFT_361934 [Violaceomyces palustris]|uniref:Uncharacterized protein n=1 Tax=Violaceomyces palustris TaxID=1673888 RepID=A0ACD0NYY0_9BASI|nr:hypothetical protein IE53DRAFT_361934 [Violaceomyces palustris]